MASTSNITISLQSTAPSKGMEPDKSSKNSGLETEARASGFDKALEEAQTDKAPDTGKELPRGGDMRDERSVADEQIRVDLQGLQVRKAGKLSLVTSPDHNSDVSDASLISFMREQGFSRADMAQLLTAKRDQQSTASWLKIRGGGIVGAESKISVVEELKPTNLAEALAAQLMEPKQLVKPSPIVEVLAMKDLTHVVKTQITSESANQFAIKFSDLLPALTRRQVGDGSSNQGESSDSGSFSSNQFDTKSLSELAKISSPQEFREFLAEHLKRAESLRALTDKLGNMIARQIAGQIGRGRWSLEIAMHPAELGSIEIEMEMTERGLEASFRASHSTTRDLLMESMPRLKSWFEEGGIDVAYTGLNQDSGAQSGGKSTGEQRAQPETQATESQESSDSTDDKLLDDDSTGLDIRV